jgi:hypothetical protein
MNETRAEAGAALPLQGARSRPPPAARGVTADHLSAAPARSLFQRAISDRKRSSRAAGVANSADTGAVPRAAKRSVTLASVRAFRSEAASFSLIGSGVLLGAQTACQAER